MEWVEEYNQLNAGAWRLWQLFLEEAKAMPNALERGEELMQLDSWKKAAEAYRKSQEFYEAHAP